MGKDLGGRGGGLCKKRIKRIKIVGYRSKEKNCDQKKCAEK